jgi:hypothetical protein
VFVAVSPTGLVIDVDAVLQGLPHAEPRPILHVPKLRVT